MLVTLTMWAKLHAGSGSEYIASYAVPAYMASTYLVSAFPAHSTSFPQNASKSSTVKCALSSESEWLLAVRMHSVSPWYVTLRGWLDVKHQVFKLYAVEKQISMLNHRQ